MILSYPSCFHGHRSYAGTHTYTHTKGEREGETDRQRDKEREATLVVSFRRKYQHKRHFKNYDKSLFFSQSSSKRSNKSMALLFHHLLSLSSFHSVFSKASFRVSGSLIFQQCAAQALASCWFISSPSCFLRPRASASSKVVVRGLPRVSGNSIVSTPMMKARIPTMS